MLSLWRPLDIIEDSPMTFCDSRTLRLEDCIAADVVSVESVEENYYVRPRASQSWYWLSSQTPEEPCIFLSYDSNASQADGFLHCELALSIMESLILD